jgi:hypothetical protein
MRGCSWRYLQYGLRGKFSWRSPSRPLILPLQVRGLLRLYAPSDFMEAKHSGLDVAYGSNRTTFGRVCCRLWSEVRALYGGGDCIRRRFHLSFPSHSRIAVLVSGL